VTGWFPFLFYSTTWVGETYLRYDAPAAVKESDDMTGQVGRIGSLALIGFSIVTFIMSVLLPFMVKSPEGEEPPFTARPPAKFATLVEKAGKFKPTLLTAWTISHGVFAAAMCLAPFVQSLRGATLIIGICGMYVYLRPNRLPHQTNDTSSWAISCWAPFAFLGVEINRLSSTASYVPLGRNSIDLDSPSTLHLQQPDSEQQSTSEGSGKYLGIMNVYTTLPQFVGTGISFVVFSLLEPGKSPELSDAPEHEHHSTDGVNAISVCLFIGAMCAVVAGFTTAKLGRIAKY
jgi:solute carrier family 45 protein 1/2/4